MKDSQNNQEDNKKSWGKLSYRSTLDFIRRRKDFLIIVIGVLSILIGSVVPISYDLWGDPHSFLNNNKALAVLIALLLLIVFLAIYSIFFKDCNVVRRMSIVLLILSILLIVVGIVFTIAWTAAIINKEFGFGPGLYIMFIGSLFIFIGSIMNFRKNKKLAPHKNLWVDSGIGRSPNT
jgi:glucan phosphoethanolaminetransferase (alkaline phosphatase superfamily)